MEGFEGDVSSVGSSSEQKFSLCQYSVNFPSSSQAKRQMAELQAQTKWKTKGKDWQSRLG